MSIFWGCLPAVKKEIGSPKKKIFNFLVKLAIFGVDDVRLLRESGLADWPAEELGPAAPDPLTTNR